MSEPNDTAQEGFDQLKRNLEVRYPEDSDLSLDEFLNVESLLALAVRVCGPGADPRKADRLLSNYQLIRPETIGADGHLMQMARRHLFSLASSTAWRRLLGLYERAEYERYRFFDIANGGMALREHPLTGIDRMPIYIDRLLGDVKLSHKNVVARPKGRYSYTCKPEATGDTTVTGSIRWVTIPDAVPPQTGKIDDIPRKSRRPPIDITLDELISTADEVGEKTGKTHYAAVLRRVKDQGLLKRARGGSTSVADGLRLDEVVSLVGLVGAGKSVLANMLIVCLAKRGLRAVSLLNSVSDVMESVVLLREAGISASPWCRAAGASNGSTSSSTTMTPCSSTIPHPNTWRPPASWTGSPLPIPRPADTAARHAAASGPRRAARTHARTGTCAHRRPWPASP